jgi:cytochrome c peroxidase
MIAQQASRRAAGSLPSTRPEGIARDPDRNGPFAMAWAMHGFPGLGQGAIPVKAPLALTVIVAALSCSACKGKELAPSPAASASTTARVARAVDLDATELAAFAPLPSVMASDANPLTETKIALGRQLYYDARFSKNQEISCNTCHDLARYGVDGEAFSTGHGKQKGGRNGPSVYNAAGHVAQFWDGRAPDVEKQALGPVLNPVEMATKDDKAVVAVLRSIPEYVTELAKAFPEDKNAVSFDNFGKAIGAFERKLVTPGRWDKYLKGDKTALSAAEKQGARTFIATGCTACHNGAYVGGATFQKLGAVRPWPNQKDQGRFEVTKKDSDRMVFKVPSLRNVAKTGPYFHDASAKTLREAIVAMASHQLGKELSDADVTSISAFLEALTGEIPTSYVKTPELPKSTPATPKPDPN